MNLKSQIMQAIEQGLTNKQIVELLGSNIKRVEAVRGAYNEISPEPIRSPVQTKPKEGTSSRLVYDYLAENNNAPSGDIKSATGADYGTISYVRKRFFGHKPRVNKWIAQPVAMKTVELSELTL
jgi:uncharacterized protein YggU (UPF0235/DUF167 family)